VNVAGARLDGLSARRLSQWRARHVGLVFQFYHLLPMLSVERNVALPLLLTKVPASQHGERARIVMELLGIAHCAQRRPTELSGGQQQRVAIARAIVADPTLLICDEPTGDLDRANAQSVLQILKELNQKQGKTIVMATHDPLAANYASRILRLDKGRQLSDSGSRRSAA
jgi:putative ABC transport system ATP-binding protein